MSVQNTYNFNPRIAVEGHHYSTAIDDSTTKVTEGAVPFGRAVVQGTNPDGQIKLPAGAAPKFYGVALRSVGLENPYVATGATAGERISYLAKEAAKILRAGYVAVFTEQAVTPADPVFYRHTAGAGGTELGRFRKDADTNTAVKIEGAAFESSATAGSIVKIRLPAHSQI